MRKKLSRFFVAAMVSLFGVVFSVSNAVPAQAPIYDPTYANGAGAFFANGTPITISDVGGTTTITWNGGTQAITPTTTVYGGGQAGTSYDSSSITLNSGNVSTIYGGGFSTDEANPAIVDDANITINGGNVTNAVIGGGFLYTQVNDVDITMNGGTAFFLQGGGIAAGVYEGVEYSTGTEENPQASGTIVRNADIIINDGNVRVLYGGGQGYSNTENTSVTINDGEFDFVTAGGSNGYTGNSTVDIRGGDISVYQSTNRGTVNNATVRQTGGTVDNFYIGGETSDPTVTGVINNANVRITGGRVTNLNQGTSGGTLLDTTQPEYNIVFTDNVVENNNLPAGSGTDITGIIWFLIILGIFTLAFYFGLILF